MSVEPAVPAYDLELLLAERRRRTPTKPFASLEELATRRDLFGLVTATPVQRAVFRIAEGLPLGDLADVPAVVGALGGSEAVTMLPHEQPRELVILSGIRVGKSLIAALLAIYWSQTCDVSKLGPGEIPRISIVSVKTDLADVVFDHIVGRIMASEALKALMIGEPTAEGLFLRHPTGIPVEVKVVAGARAGASLVARWSAGCIFDEFPRMNGEDDGVINWDHSRRAVLDRILPNAQLVSIGSPWAPHGPAYDAYHSNFGKPTVDMVLLKAPGWDFNPYFWTPAQIAKSQRNPDIYVTECLAEFASPEESLLSQTEIDSCTRAAPVWLAPDPRLSYRAAMDPATRGNGWTFVVATRVGAVKKIVRAEERRGSKLMPLKPREVMAEYAAICKEYGITTIDSDQHLADAIQEIAHDHGIHIRQINWTERDKAKKYQSLKTKMALAQVELPPDRVVRTDLLQIRKKTTNNGVKIVLPSGADNRHCDYAPAIVMALSEYLEDVEPASQSADEMVASMAYRLKEERRLQVLKRQQRDPSVSSQYQNRKLGRPL